MSSVERVAEDGTIACGDDNCQAGGRAFLWMLDLDEDDRPYEAHRVASHTGATAVTACGRTVTASTHPRGWWQTHPDELPLAERSIHCRHR